MILERIIMKLEQAIKYAIDGDALLFLGAGFSVGAKSKNGDDLLTGRSLAKYLYKEINDETDDDQLNFASEAFQDEYGQEKLLDIIKDMFIVSQVSDLHVEVAKVPWKSIYTTNYDDIIEYAHDKLGKNISSITPKQDKSSFTSTTPSCLHINGYAKNATVDDLGSDLKLTNTSYLSAAFADSNWGFLFRQAIEFAKVIIFIGYSMYDIDIQRILANTPSNKDKTIFIDEVGLTEKQLNRSIQNKFGEIYPIGLQGFIDQYLRISDGYVPVDRSQQYFYLEEIKPSQNNADIRDDDLFDLLFKGEFKDHLISQSLFSNLDSSYFVHRDKHDVFVNALLAGEKNFVIHSDMANGKSAFMRGIGLDVLRKGYRVFWMDKEVGDFHDDYENLLTVDEPTVLIIENILRHNETIKYLSMKKNPNLVIVGSCKSVFYDTNNHFIDEMFLSNQHFEIDLNVLSQPELTKFSDLFDIYKFWGERENLSRQRKINYLAENCNSALSSILLEIIKSPDIHSRFSGLFKLLHRDDEASNIVITASVLTMLGYEVSDYLILELSGNNSIYKSKFKTNESVRELIDIRDGKNLPKSSVLAKFALTNHSDAKSLIDTIIMITKNAHNKSELDGLGSIFFEIYKSLVNYGVLQSMLPERGKRDALIRFYENTKNLSSANHPHFWLQYAIARLAYGESEDLVKAKLYLDTAYSKAMNLEEKRGFPYHKNHMDNVKARYLMKHGISSNSRDVFMMNFKEAHVILLRQANNEKNERAYRIASLYSTFWDVKQGSLTDEDINYIKNAAKQMVEVSKLSKARGRAAFEVDRIVIELTRLASQ